MYRNEKFRLYFGFLVDFILKGLGNVIKFKYFDKNKLYQVWIGTSAGF